MSTRGGEGCHLSPHIWGTDGQWGWSMKNTAGVVGGEVREAGGPDRTQENRVRIASFQ